MKNIILKIGKENCKIEINDNQVMHTIFSVSQIQCLQILLDFHQAFFAKMPDYMKVIAKKSDPMANYTSVS